MWLKAHLAGIAAQQIVPTVVCKESTQGFHEEMRIYLQGHGIETYREIRYDAGLQFEVLVHDV